MYEYLVFISAAAAAAVGAQRSSDVRHRKQEHTVIY